MIRKLDPEKRENYLQAALKLFVENGVQNTSTAAIAKAAGTAAGTLFLYFPTKQDLIDELVLKVGREQAEYMNTLLEQTFSVRETFITILEGSIRWFMQNVDAYQYIQQVRNTGIISESAVQESGKFYGYYYTAIQRGLAEERIKPYPLDLIGEVLYQQIVAIMSFILTQPDAAEQERYIQMGCDIFWSGIKGSDN